jgi:hypothetical protein
MKKKNPKRPSRYSKMLNRYRKSKFARAKKKFAWRIKNLSVIKFFRRMFTIAYANAIYRNKVRKAEKIHGLIRDRVFVALSFDRKQLLVLNRKRYRSIKRYVYKSRLDVNKHNMYTLAQGCFYHTADRIERGALDKKDKEARRLAFIKIVLEKSQLT